MMISRRGLLVVGCGALAVPKLGCGGGDTVPLPAAMAAGPASAVSADTLTPVPGAPVAIARDANGIYALSLMCTHQQCDMSRSGGGISFQGITCGCHGSVFSASGAVLRGPATAPLPHLLVTEDASGQLTIHGDQTVSADVRLPA